MDILISSDFYYVTRKRLWGNTRNCSIREFTSLNKSSRAQNAIIIDQS